MTESVQSLDCTHSHMLPVELSRDVNNPTTHTVTLTDSMSFLQMVKRGIGIFSYLVEALRPVNYKGLFQG